MKKGKSVSFNYDVNSNENGAIDNDSNIVLNLANMNNKNRLNTKTAVHEVTHALSKSDKNSLHDIIVNISNSAVQKGVEGTKSKYKDQYQDQSKETQEQWQKEEVVSEFMEKLIGNPRKFLKSINGDLSVMEKIGTLFKSIGSMGKSLSKADKSAINSAYNIFKDALTETKETKETSKKETTNTKSTPATTKLANARFSIDKNKKPRYNITKQEFAVLREAVVKKNAEYKNKDVPSIDFAFTANNFYVYNNNGYDSFGVIDGLDIDTNKELIDYIMEVVKNGSYGDAKTFSKHIDGYGPRAGRNNRRNDDAEGKRANGPNGGLLGRKSTRKSIGHTGTSSGDTRRQTGVHDNLTEDNQTRKSTDNQENEIVDGKNNPLSNIDIYSPKQYKDFGWAVVNGTLSVKKNGDGKSEYALFNELLSNLKRDKHSFPKTKAGESMLAVYDKIVYVTGSYQNPKISKVIELKYGNETNNDIVRNQIYDFERYGHSINELLEVTQDYFGQGYFNTVKAEDGKTYQESKREWQLRSVPKSSRRDNQDNRNRNGRISNTNESHSQTRTTAKRTSLKDTPQIQSNGVKATNNPLSNISKYTKPQYKDFGWAVVNGTLSLEGEDGHKSEYSLFQEIWSNIRNQGYPSPRSKEGHYIIEVNNKLVYAKGSYQSPQIDFVLKIDYPNEMDRADISRAILTLENKRSENKYGNFYSTEDITEFVYSNAREMYGQGNIGRFANSDYGTFSEAKKSWAELGKIRQGTNAKTRQGNDGSGTTKTNDGTRTTAKRTSLKDTPQNAKSYTKSDAKDVLMEALNSDLFSADFVVKNKGDTVKYMFEVMNKTKEGDTGKSANMIADYLINNMLIRQDGFAELTADSVATNIDITKQAVMMTLLLTGLRRGELCGLNWSDIDFEKKKMKIRKSYTVVYGHGLILKDPKTDKSTRTMTLPQILVDKLASYKMEWDKKKELLGDRVEDGDSIFITNTGKRMHPSTINKWLSDILDDIGEQHMTVHSLRHTNITMQIIAGVPISIVAGRAGHARTSTTLDIYAHVISTADQEAADKLNNMFA